MRNCLLIICHPVKKEFRKDKCGFDHKPADAFVKSQWQNCSRSIPYLIYRWVIGLFFTAAVVESMVNMEESASFWLYFIYMTNWGIMMCMLTNLFGAILVTIWHYHPEYADKLLNMDALTSPFRIYWGMHIISLVVSVVVTIMYWGILYNPVEYTIDATNIMTHALNSVFMCIDLWMVSHPMRLLHIFWPVLFGLVYTIFSIIYYKCGGLNIKGKPYIYNVLDWSQPEKASFIVLGVILLSCFVYMVLFTLYKLRALLHRRINRVSFFLPTTNGKQTHSQHSEKHMGGGSMGGAAVGTGIQHSPSGISMVLGNYTGYQNPAFTASRENCTK